jgi:hypothetical protein
MKLRKLHLRSRGDLLAEVVIGQRRGHMLSHIRIFTNLVIMVIMMMQPSFAQRLPADSVDPKTLLAKQNCDPSNVIYTGPVSLEKRAFTADPYIWFTTKEFAERFCMPSSFIDPQLKGALAIAVRLIPNPLHGACRRVSLGEVTCNIPEQLMFEVYFDNKTSDIPKADPAVDYYSGWLANSSELFNHASWRWDQRRLKNFKDNLGERPAFNPNGPEGIRDTWTNFFWLTRRGDWASGGAELIENYYRANWMPGIDVIRLNYGQGYASLGNPDDWKPHKHDKDQTTAYRGQAIGIIRTSELTHGVNEGIRKIPFPQGYRHVIYIPHKLAQLVHAYDHKSGAAFFGDIHNRMEAITGRPAPQSTPNTAPLK